VLARFGSMSTPIAHPAAAMATLEQPRSVSAATGGTSSEPSASSQLLGLGDLRKTLPPAKTLASLAGLAKALQRLTKLGDAFAVALSTDILSTFEEN
jgi:hypothetical protein